MHCMQNSAVCADFRQELIDLFSKSIEFGHYQYFDKYWQGLNRPNQRPQFESLSSNRNK